VCHAHGTWQPTLLFSPSLRAVGPLAPLGLVVTALHSAARQLEEGEGSRAQEEKLRVEIPGMGKEQLRGLCIEFEAHLPPLVRVAIFQQASSAADLVALADAALANSLRHRAQSAAQQVALLERALLLVYSHLGPGRAPTGSDDFEFRQLLQTSMQPLIRLLHLLPSHSLPSTGGGGGQAASDSQLWQVAYELLKSLSSKA